MTFPTFLKPEQRDAYGLLQPAEARGLPVDQVQLLRDQLATASPLAAAILSGLPLPSSAVVTALPSTPVDGQEISFVADAANGIVWRLKYRAASASAYKWEYLGGSPLRVYIGTSEGTATINAWVDLATVGPSIVTPLAGDWLVHGSAVTQAPAGSGANSYMGMAIGATTVSAPYTEHALAGAAYFTTYADDIWFTSLASGSEIRMRYQCNAANTLWAFRVLLVTPIRVG